MTVAQTSTGPPSRERATLGDLIAGATSAGFGVAVLVYVRGFPRLPDGAPGPALFPGIIGALFLLFGSVLVFRYLRDRRAPVPVEETTPSPEGTTPAPQAEEFESLLDEPVPVRTAWVNALSVVGSIVLYLLVANLLGFSLTMGVLLVALMWRLGARLLVAVPAAVVTTLVIYVVFQRILLVPLPPGILG